MTFDHLTAEQKARAFDLLLKHCGSQQGTLRDFKSVEISRPGAPPDEARFRRVPRYTYTIIGEDLPTFADLLHHLATVKA